MDSEEHGEEAFIRQPCNTDAKNDNEQNKSYQLMICVVITSQ